MGFLEGLFLGVTVSSVFWGSLCLAMRDARNARREKSQRYATRMLAFRMKHGD